MEVVLRRGREDDRLLQLEKFISWGVIDIAPLTAPVSVMDRV
jgi:hypothetical protein